MNINRNLLYLNYYDIQDASFRGYIYIYGFFMLRFDRKQQNSVKQLSFNKKNVKKKSGFKGMHFWNIQG